MDKILEFLKENWMWMAPIIYEAIVRIWPTKWDLSLLNLITRIIDKIIANKRIPDPEDVPAPGTNGKQNLVPVDSNKHIAT